MGASHYALKASIQVTATVALKHVPAVVAWNESTLVGDVLNIDLLTELPKLMDIEHKFSHNLFYVWVMKTLQVEGWNWHNLDLSYGTTCILTSTLTRINDVTFMAADNDKDVTDGRQAPTTMTPTKIIGEVKSTLIGENVSYPRIPEPNYTLEIPNTCQGGEMLIRCPIPNALSVNPSEVGPAAKNMEWAYRINPETSTPIRISLTHLDSLPNFNLVTPLEREGRLCAISPPSLHPEEFSTLLSQILSRKH
ncbi:unnamed protein product [Lactuca saligna]|uniref:Uncharacterized protein n=1 Tax=Lactuca saligna TaxID=75948 RepID=A0AA35YSU7_LACSI|nr:unnamed protein product [Lactuca saligna]